MSDENKNLKDCNWIPWLFVLFFVVFITVDIFYIYIAQKTWQGVATEDAYQKGLNYNQVIKYVKEQKDLGWKMQIKYSPSNSKIGDLDLVIYDKQNRIINDAKVLVVVTRPLQSGYDFEVELPFDYKKFSYNSRLKFPLKGQWNFEIQVARGSETYQEVKRLIIQ